MTTPLISIIMAMYNMRPYVAGAIGSVLRQNYDNFELVVVDDGSTDGSYDVAGEFHDPRIRLMRTENRGLSAARNLGIEQSNGNYFVFLDSDDFLTEKSLSSRMIAITKSGADCAFSQNIISININGHTKYKCMSSGHNNKKAELLWNPMDLIDRFLEGRFFIFAQAFLISRAVMARIAGFDTNIKVAVDVEFVSRLLPACQSLVETFEPCYIYRRTPDSLSSINSRRKAVQKLDALRQAHSNLALYSAGREAAIARGLFKYCVQMYPYWTADHRLAMAEAQRLHRGRRFDLACVGGPRAQAVAHVLGWRAGRLWTFGSSFVRRWLSRVCGRTWRLHGRSAVEKAVRSRCSPGSRTPS